MKTIKITGLLLGATLMASLTSCEETIPRAEHETVIASVVETDKHAIDSIERMYITTLDEIDNNIDQIHKQQGLIAAGPKSGNDLGISKKEQIINNISMINTLLEENKAKLAKLEKSLASYKRGKKELVASIAQAKERMTAMETEIQDLKTLLAQNEFKIGELNKQLDERNTEVATLTEKNTTLDKDLNRVYFAAGTYKELKSKEILVKEGGVLGMGRTKALNQNLDKAKFSELSQKETTTIVLNGKKPKLITKHPVNSYTVTPTENDMAQLTIKDPGSFWSYSKYLVVEVQ